jgi:cell division protein FtsB
MGALRRGVAGSLLAVLALTAAGCGPDLKAENESLKKQVADAQKQSGDLKGQVDTLMKENETLKKQVADLQARLKPAAKPAAKPTTKKM